LAIYIAVGSIVFLLSFFGCFGAVKENICITWAVGNHSLYIYNQLIKQILPKLQYATSMLVMLIISIVLLFVFRMHFDEASLTKLQKTFAKQTNTFDAMAEYQTQVRAY